MVVRYGSDKHVCLAHLIHAHIYNSNFHIVRSQAQIEISNNRHVITLLVSHHESNEWPVGCGERSEPRRSCTHCMARFAALITPYVRVGCAYVPVFQRD